MQEMLYVKETPWKGLGTQYPTQPSSGQELVEQAKLNWTCTHLPMSTEWDATVLGYNAIYREDCHELLGVVNKKHPIIVQNSEMFNAFDYLLGREVDVETASSFDGGVTVFGSFKIREQYKLFDDDIDHYFVVVNDHLKPDGKVSVLNTPVRIVCQNTLELAMHRNFYHLRVPMGADVSINKAISQTILESVGSAIMSLQSKSEELYKKKITPAYVDRVMDELFPFPDVDDDTVLHTKAIEAVEIERDTFRDMCLGADNLNNYRFTQFWVAQGLMDFYQHYHKKADKAYDLGYRMKKLSGVGTPVEQNPVAKFLKIADKIAA